jgi:hypothetical protein
MFLTVRKEKILLTGGTPVTCNLLLKTYNWYQAFTGIITFALKVSITFFTSSDFIGM